MSFTSRLRHLLGVKESQARIITSMNQVGQPQYTPANYEAFAREGYSKNAIVYSAINKITTAAMGVKWTLYTKSSIKKNQKEIIDHEFLKLWERPNPMQATAAFIEAIIGYRLISGNSYIEANKPITSKPPRELWPVRPDKMKVIPNSLGNVGAYEFSSGGATKRWLVDPMTMRGDILHMKMFHPINDWYGLSPIQAALLSLDQNNAASRWNLAMLQNSATPSGVLQMKVSDANPRGELTEPQYARLKAEFESSYTGARNAGRPLIIEGGLNWQGISLSPKDMDFINSKKITGTDIALVYNVPPELLGLGEKTYANYQEARAALYEEAVLPIMDNLRDELNAWLLPMFGDSLYLDYDRDDIEALSYKRDAKYTSIGASTFLTQNEKREAVGYEPKEGWDVFVVGNQIVESPEDFVVNSGGFGSNEPSKPEDTEVEETEEDEEEIEDQEIIDVEDEDEKGFKNINLVNANEKRRSWRYQNRKRALITKNFKEDVEKDLNDLTKQLVKIADDLKGSDSKVIEFAMVKALSEWSPELEKTLKKYTKQTLEEFGAVVLTNAKNQNLILETKVTPRQKFDSFILSYIEQRSGTQVSTITSSTQKRIQRVIREWTAETVISGDSIPELSKYLQMEFEDLTPNNALRIARTEVGLASNNGSLEAVKALQLPNMQKEWVSASDDRVRDGSHGYADHAAVNGKLVGLDEKFDVPPDATMNGPGDPGATADQVINCRCVLVYKSNN